MWQARKEDAPHAIRYGLSVLAGILSLAAFTHQAGAAAMFSSTASLTLYLPGNIADTFGIVASQCRKSGRAWANGSQVGSHTASCGASTITPGYGSNPGTNWPGGPVIDSEVLTATASVSGTAYAPGNNEVAAAQYVSYSIGLSNLTGGVPPSPPSQLLDAPFFGTIRYDVSSSVDDPVLGSAVSALQVMVRADGVAPAGWTDIVRNCASGGACFDGDSIDFSFAVLVPIDGFASLQVEINEVFGDAAVWTPEPASIALALGGLAIGFGIRRKARKA